MTVRIATRGSKLALWQAHHIRDRLVGVEPGLEVEFLVLKTVGDKIVDRPLSEVGGKGLFVKEIEEALIDGRADVAVHSMKDLPAEIPPELIIAAVPEREDPHDALIVAAGLTARTILELPRGARVGTSSLRRVCALRSLRPDLQIVALRGNVDTRIRRLDDGELDAIVLAAAGLNRLGFGDRIASVIPAGQSLPAIGQGALAVEARRSDDHTRARLQFLNHAPTAIATTAERAFLGRLGGSCRTPLAAHGILDGGTLALRGLVGMPDGTRVLRDQIEGPAADAERLGVTLAERLIAAGAEEILRAVGAT